MHKTKHSIARTGPCIARAEHLIPANDSLELGEPPPQVWVLRYTPDSSLCERSESGACWCVYPTRAAALADCQEQEAPGDYEAVLLPPGIPYLWEGHVRPGLTPEQCDEMARLVADTDRDFNKGPKLARRHDAVAFDRQTGASQVRMVLGFELREIDQRDARNLAAAWTGLDRSDLDLPKAK